MDKRNEDTENYKRIVEELFEKLDMDKNEPEPTACIFDDATSVKAALAELEEIRKAYIEFQSKTSHFVMFGYLNSAFENFAEYAADITEIIKDDIDETKLCKSTMNKYKKIKQLRSRILSSIAKRYGDKDGRS